MAELPEDLLTVIKKRWAEMKEEEHRSEPKKQKTERARCENCDCYKMLPTLLDMC